MLYRRLPLALAEGLIQAPLAVIGAPGDLDAGDLPAPLTAVTQMQPDHDRLSGAGLTVSRHLPDRVATAIVVLPRSRTAALDRIARAARVADRLLIDGQKTDGVDAILKACRERAEVGEVIAKAHGKAFSVTGGDFSDWLAEPATADGWTTRPGVFSADGPDPGSVALAEALPPLSGRVADLGAGWGYLSRRILESPGVARLDLVEADATALDCAGENVMDDRAAFHWADAAAWRPGDPLDHVVTNPPFHQGRAADPSLGRAFIATAAATLHARGTLWLVANRHLPYERSLGETFAEVTELAGPAAYKLYRASRPRRTRR